MPSINNPIQPQPIQKQQFALSLSGGGFRAAAFHLGVLSFFYHFEFIDNIRFLSTVSGGSIVGAAWALSREKKENFNDFYNHFKSNLKDSKLISDSLHHMRHGYKPPHASGQSLITCLAKVYDDVFFHGACLDQLQNRPSNSYYVFNATDFRNGVAFRFCGLPEKSKSRIIGNYYLYLTREESEKNNILEKIKIADVVAASSCFPGGFEPMVFPSDFNIPHKKNNINLEDLNFQYKNRDEIQTPRQVALMDGGVYDNQGVDSILTLTDDEGKNDKLKVDFIFISDVDQAKSVFYEISVKKTTVFEFISVGLVFHSILIVLILSSFLSVLYFYLQWEKIIKLSYWWVLVFGQSLNVLFVLCYFFMRNKIKHILSQVPQANPEEVWRSLLRLSVADGISVIRHRISSLVEMSSGIFMKRVRRLEQDLIMKNKSLSEKSIFMHIYELKDKEYEQSDKSKNNNLVEHELKVSDELKSSIESAVNMGTTLWFDLENTDKNTSFDNEQIIKNLILTGQATCCAVFYKNSKKLNLSVEQKENLISYWKKLNKN